MYKTMIFGQNYLTKPGPAHAGKSASLGTGYTLICGSAVKYFDGNLICYLFFQFLQVDFG